MTTATPLKACPFCPHSGAEAVLIDVFPEAWEDGDGPSKKWVVRCNYCGVQTDSHPTKEEAIAQWEKRESEANSTLGGVT